MAAGQPRPAKAVDPGRGTSVDSAALAVGLPAPDDAVPYAFDSRRGAVSICAEAAAAEQAITHGHLL